jgi:hypothetical protein
VVRGLLTLFLTVDSVGSFSCQITSPGPSSPMPTRSSLVHHEPHRRPEASGTPGNASLADWFQLIRAEYLEIPGLHLTPKQAQRLWNLDPVTCDRLLKALLDVRVRRGTRHLCRSHRRGHRRSHQGRPDCPRKRRLRRGRPAADGGDVNSDSRTHTRNAGTRGGGIRD